MSTSRGGSRRTQREEEENDNYWIYLPQGGLMDFVPSWRSTTVSQNRRRQINDPWWLFEEGSAGGPNFGLPSRLTQQLLLIDDYNSRPRVRDNDPPHRFNNEREEQSSKLSEEEQRQALNKLRKQLYSPHMSNIIKRLGNQNYSKEAHSHIDDDLKKCAICLDDFESKCFVTSTPCNHFFHEECIVPWVKTEGKCPVCRYVFVEKNGWNNGRGNNNATNVNTLSRGNNGINVERDRVMSHVRSFGRASFY